MSFKTIQWEKHKRDFLRKNRNHQESVLSEIAFLDKANIIMPTGTGKSRIIYSNIMETIDQNSADIYAIASHRLLLNTQHLHELFETFAPGIADIRFVLIGSYRINEADFQKNPVLNNYLKDNNLSIPEVILSSGSTKEITEFINSATENGKDVICISTYHSLDKLRNLDIRSIYCDEAHMLATGKTQAEFQTNYNTINAKNRYFFTATAKDYDDKNGGNNPDRFLMDNCKFFGKRIELGFKDSVENALITKPYLHYVELEDNDFKNDYANISNYTRTLIDTFKKHNTIVKRDSVSPKKIAGKLLVKCSGVAEMWKIQKNLLKINELNDVQIYCGASKSDDDTFGRFYANGNYIDDKTEFLTALKNIPDTQKAIILHYDILSEGIDVPGITGVMFLSKSLPTIPKILQTIGRSTRLFLEDRLNIYANKLLPEQKERFVKPYCAVILPVLNTDMEFTRREIAELVMSLDREFGFNPVRYIELGKDQGNTKKDEPEKRFQRKKEKRANSLFHNQIVHTIEGIKSEELETKRRLERLEFHKSREENPKLWAINWSERFKNHIESGRDADDQWKSFYKTSTDTDKHNQTQGVANTGIQTTFTPKEIREKMIKGSGVEEENQVLVIANPEFIHDLLKIGTQPTFISDDAELNHVIRLVYNINTQLVPGYKFTKEQIENLKIMKFDLIISNPPYNKGLDLKILKSIWDIGTKITFVHPAGWLYDNKKINKLFNNTRELVKDHFINYEKVETPNELFNIGLFTDLFITYFHKEQRGLGDEIYNIDIHGDSPPYRELKRKILEYCTSKDNLWNRVDYHKKKDSVRRTEDLEWEVGFSGIRGHPNTIDFYTIIQLTNENLHISKTTDYKLKFYFKTESDALNFKNYLKLKITRFALSIFKINQHLESGELLAVPYMPTYEKPWTEESVAQELGLTTEELKWAMDWIPNYYPEDEMK